MLDFDEVLEEIGEFGRFQIINYLLLCLPLFFSAGNSLTYVFTAGVPNYRCFVEGCDQKTNPIYSEPWLENAIPSSASSGSYVADQCLQYIARGNMTPGQCTSQEFSVDTVKCDHWVFEDNERTIVNEWNITCMDNQWKLSLVGTVHFVGILFGTVIFGFLADRYGRKIIFVFCIVLMSVTGIAQAACNDYLSFQFFVFINALGTSGVYPLAFILAVELVGRRKREMSGVILNYFYAVGEASIGLIAWLTKDWVTIQLAVSIPPAIFIFYYWLVPESVRWLIARKDTKRATLIVKQAAKMNGVALSSGILNSIEDGSNSDDDSFAKKEEVKLWDSIKQLLRSRVLVIRSLLLFYIWAANAFVYYGLSVNSTTLGGNKYLNFALVCLVEVPGYTFSWWTMNKFGRRWSFSGSMFLCSVTCVAAAFVPEEVHWATVVLFLLGKLGITSSFGIAYVYTTELYPTIMRSIGVGACSTVGRLGAIVAPFAPLLAIYMKPLPLLLFSGVSLVASVFTLWLPETLGTRLPDTVAEAADLRRLSEKKPTSPVGSVLEKESTSS